MSDQPPGNSPPRAREAVAAGKAWRPAVSKADDLADVYAICEAAHDKKAENVVALDVSNVSSIADTFVLATGTSDRHVRAVTDAVHEATRRLGAKPLGTEGYEEARWVLVDYGQTIVHIFQRETREHYDLERLWSDATQLEVPSPEPPPGPGELP